ncbi:hypothetical protein KAFR_0B01980 [Kazachstania africana CBS 2517]|uniref:Mitochondrial carrier protein n=1 Tax=Kazachstania africana (strain ATCC 22294 / BCRC 22015 / CBS 2517 / CECT 1963 / NBRC 1671 / NRRL Y-8276) TaxID=1071382 RepID=H2AQ46_KAZAF|nr:hypothetical protein KAFR_0B01980 [Kazachstania africana CBS 2517]CCF56496.1 hypothetical protein KAFR_0B01980 [Kazachstania africana CBS 2517]
MNEMVSTAQTILQNESNVTFVSGGIAGAVSRTVVSPFERVKILLQVQSTRAPYNNGVFKAISQVYKEENVKGLFRGNGLNCIRVFPYSAVQFVVYDYCKKNIFHVDKNSAVAQLTNVQRLISGALCGGCSIIATYPLDLLKTRLSIQTSNLENLRNSKAANTLKPPGFWQLFSKVYREEGKVFGLFRGIWPTSLGIIPYVALNFTIYEQLREYLPKEEDVNNLKSSLKQNTYMLTIGAISGGVAQTLTYPFDLLRRRFQILTMGNNELGFYYTGIYDALKTIARTEGLRGYYKGLEANLLKVVPSTAVSWLVYEMTCNSIKRL